MDNEELFKNMRERMVQTQIESRGITDVNLLNAMRKVPRHLFVSTEKQSKAYDDCAMAIEEGQTISQPYMVAIMTEQLALTGIERVLEIGTGSGYQTALLAELANEVYSVERLRPLAESSERLLITLGYNNITIKVGDGTLGLDEYSPYDCILCAAGAPNIPQPWFDQLAIGGRIVSPVGDKSMQYLKIALKDNNGKISVSEYGGCVFVPLIGELGWNQ